MKTEFADISTGAAQSRLNARQRSSRRIRQIAATTTALTFMLQSFAWAVCNDGSTFPPGGFTPAIATNWSPLTFTGTLGSAWVPDISVNEHNNPGEPLTHGGHDWVFDQGSTTCKETDVGGASGPVTAWSIPPNNTTDCILLPILRISNGALVIQNFGDIPQRGAALTPTCDPTLLSTNGPNPANTYLNQLGCALVLLNTGQIQATTPETATTFLFTSGIKGGVFAYPLINFPVSSPGQEAGKAIGGGVIFYADLNPSQRFDSAVITPDGRYLLGGSSKTNDAIFACRNPLGDPGDLTQPIDMQAFAVSTDTSFGNKTGVQCMQIGQGGDGRVKGLAIGADGQPYIGGINIMSNFTDFPACIAANFGGAPAGSTIDTAIAFAFKANSQNHCKATPNKILNTSPDGTTAIRAETFALVSHGNYLYHALKGGEVFQANVDATEGVTSQRFFATGLASPTGIGFSQDNGTPSASTMLYDDPTGLALAAQERIYKLPICEDFQ
jgi:hypothetical protein